jgi:hypothetical protein
MELDLAHDVPIAQQKWRKYLILVDTGTKYLGLRTEATDGIQATDRSRRNDGLPFVLYGTMVYEPPRLEARPGNVPGVLELVLASPPVVFPFDTFGPVRLDIVQCRTVLFVGEQPERVREYFFSAYQNAVEPSRVVRPQLNVAPTRER